MFALQFLENIISSYVILFVDRHHTHLPYQQSELCSELCITLISLYLNATRLFQSLNAATTRPLKLGWKPADLKWHRQNPDRILKKGMVCSCPEWSPEETFSGMLSYMEFLSLWLIAVKSRKQ
jgi:hypothetical protein